MNDNIRWPQEGWADREWQEIKAITGSKQAMKTGR